MSTPSNTPAGWYPSPGHDGHLRYWDGQEWTDDEKPVATQEQRSDPPAAWSAPTDPAVSAPTATPDPATSAPSMPAAPTTPAGWYPVVGSPGLERWWDGTQWADQTRPTAPGFPAGAPVYPVAGAAVAARTDGKLIAAGVITIVQAVLTLIAGIFVISVAQSEVGRLADDLSGGVVTFIGLIVLGIGVTLLVAGINTCRGRNWARILVIVLQAIFIVLTLGSLAGDGAGGVVIGLLISGSALILAVLGKPRPNYVSG